MDTTAERTLSGRALVGGGLTVAVLVTLVSLIFGPALQEDVRQEQRPRTLREPIAAGTAGTQDWEAIGRFDGTANCVELRTEGEVVDRACDTGPTTAMTELNGAIIAYGVAPEDATSKTVSLDDGKQLTVPVSAGELGFPVGFWAVQLPAGRSLDDSER